MTNSYTQLVTSERKLIICSIFIRLLSALLQETWFVPDEHWQSLEVAHNFVFGYGYLTWEWRIGIRSFLYPLFISVIYKILHILNIDNVLFLTLLPRIFHAFLAIICDLYTYWLCKLEFGIGAAKWTIFYTLSSWMLFYSMTRTIINSIETVLTTISIFYFFQWCHKKSYRKWPIKFVVACATAVSFRPTAAIVLLPYVLYQLKLSSRHFINIQQCYFVVGLASLTITMLIDSLYFGTFVIVPYNFLKFNLLHGIGDFYGHHPWYWYITQGLPTILGSQILPVILGAKMMKKHLFTGSIIWTTVVYSVLGHKEFRFLLPLVPISMCLAGVYSYKYIRKRLHLIIGAILFTNIFPAIYFSLWHQRGPLDVMKYLSHEVDRIGDDQTNILFLMPCHSTPYHSHIHRNISMKFLSCDPALIEQHVTDEADIFYQDPAQWLKLYFDRKSIPSHIVLFNSLLPDINHLLYHHNYVLCHKLFHAHITEGRVGSEIFIFCHQNFFGEK